MTDKLKEYRHALNLVDEAIINLLGQRYKICRKVGELKKAEQIPMMQPERVQEVINRCIELGKVVDIPGSLIENLYQLIIGHACEMETDIIDSD